MARQESERTEGVHAGFARIVGTDPTAIASAVEVILENTAPPPPQASNPYGDGNAAARIVGTIAQFHTLSAAARGESPVIRLGAS